MRLITMCAAALLLAGCANSDPAAKTATGHSGSSSLNLFGSGGDQARAAKTVVLTNFTLAADVPVIDRGFSTRQESKGGNFPILERRARTAARVNDEIIASAVATLQDAGFEALPGSPEAMRLGSKAVVVRGRLRANDKKVPVSRTGFGAGRGNVTADMTVTAASTFGSGQNFTFSASLPNNAKLPTGPAAAKRNAEIAATLTAVDATPVNLSPDVEAQARRLGVAIADKIIAHGREQGWMTKPEPKPEADEKPEAKPDSKPAPKPAQ